MKTIWQFMTNHYLYIACAILSLALTLFAYSCESTTDSLLNIGDSVNRAELQAEVDYFLARAAARFQKIDEQDAWKKAMFDQFMIANEQGKPNPAGVIALIFGALGVTGIINNFKLRYQIANGKAPTNASNKAPPATQ